MKNLPLLLNWVHNCFQKQIENKDLIFTSITESCPNIMVHEGLISFDSLNLMDGNSHKLIVYDDLFENLIADPEGKKVVKCLH